MAVATKVDCAVRQRFGFTVTEYYRMSDIGILPRDGRFELIDGDVITMSPIGDRHALAVRALIQVLPRGGDIAVLDVQNPLRLDDMTEPQPDILLLRPGTYHHHPAPEDVLLLIEVSESSLAFDRDTKVPIYCAAGVHEVWIVDVANERVIQYLDPLATEYRYVRQYSRSDKIRLTFAEPADVTIELNRLFSTS